jgi:RimJ/RimL family protein N-acetyltransferase
MVPQELTDMPPLFPGPAYRILTHRTVIRCWVPADAPLLNAAVEESRDHLRPWMPWAAADLPDLQGRANMLRSWRGRFDLGTDFVYGIFDPQERRVIGGTGLHTRAGAGAREIGYWIHKDCINQGYATEISAALTRVAFEVDEVTRVEIHCAVENVRSAAVPRKLGYTCEAVLRQRDLLEDGRWHDRQVWTLLIQEYPASPSAAAEISVYDALDRRIL